MGNVYRDAYITLAATGATDSSQGLFLPRPEQPEAVPISFEPGKPDNFVYAALHAAERYGGLDNSPLEMRAWITQEWILSRRVLHFTEAQLVYSCCTMSEAEDGQPAGSSQSEYLRTTLVPSANTAHENSENDRMDDYFLEDWLFIVEGYCSRTLTYETDKPIAIAGLISLLEERRHDRCFHGIWT